MICGLLNSASWGSPIGIGIFLVCLGIMIYFISLADRNKKGK